MSQAEASVALDFSRRSGMPRSELREVLTCVLPCGRGRSSTVVDITQVEGQATFEDIEQHLMTRLGLKQTPGVGIHGTNALDRVSAQLAVTTGHGPGNEMVGDIYYLSKLKDKWQVVRHAYWESQSYGSRGRDRLDTDSFVINVGEAGEIGFLARSYDIRNIASALKQAGLSIYSPIQIRYSRESLFVTYVNLGRLLREHGYERVRVKYLGERCK